MSYQFFEVPDLANAESPSLSSILLTAAGQTGFNGMNSFKMGSEVDVHFIIYNLPKGAAMDQKLIMTDDRGATLMDAALPINQNDSNQAQAQGTRIKVPGVRGKYGPTVTVHDQKGKIYLERRADLVVE